MPADQPTIQTGINAANKGDTVLVAPGTYYENLTISGKEITLTSSGGNQVTIIDGRTKGNVIEVDHTPTMATTINGFTIRNGYGATSDISGIHTESAGTTITNNIFTANYFAAYVLFGSVTFSNNTVYGTDPDSTCFFQNGGSGTYLFGISSILDNGGNVAPSTINNNTFVGPNLIDTQCPNQGVTADNGSPLTIANNSFTKWESGVGLFPSNYGTVTIAQNLFFNNLQGAIYALHGIDYPPADPADVFIVNNTFSNDLLRSNGIDGETYPSEIVTTGTYGKVAVENNIISSNSATNPLFDCFGTPSSPTNPVTPIIADHNLLWNPSGQIGMDGCPVTAGSFGNINAAPSFVSPTDFHPLSGSPAIDAGNNSDVTSSSDFDNHPRVQNGSHGANAIVDMGAYEYSGDSSGPYSLLTLTSSNYYLTNSNTITLSTNLKTASLGVPASASAAQTITIYENGVSAQVVKTDASGNAMTPSIVLPSAGLYTFFASYSGGSYPPANSAPLYVYVLNPVAEPATITTLNCSPNPIYEYATGLLSAMVTSTSGVPSGTVLFTDNGSSLGQTTLSSGSASLSYMPMTAGTHTIVATYSATANYASSSATCSETVNVKPSTVSLASSLNPSAISNNITFTAEVTYGGPTQTFSAAGSITFSDGNTELQTVPLTATSVGGQFIAVYSTTALAAGSHTITASLAPPVGYATGSGSLVQVVQGLPTTTALQIFPSPAIQRISVSLTATVAPVMPVATPVPSGTVSFYGQYPNSAVAVLLGTVTLSKNATAVLSISTLPLGISNINCTYSGDSTFNASNCTLVSITITAPPIASTILTLTSSSNPSPANSPITFSATLTSLGQPIANAALSLTINSQQVTLATDADGTASYTTPGLASGTYTLVANYAGMSLGTSPYGASSASITETITTSPQDFTLTTSTPSITIETQHHSSLLLTLTSIGDFNGPIAFACTGSLPPYFTCEFPQSVTLESNATQPVALTMDTDEVLNFVENNYQLPRSHLYVVLAFLLPFPLLSLAKRRRKFSKLRSVINLICLAIIASGLNACTGFYPPSTPPGTYIIPVTATGTSRGNSNAVAHMLNITLIVTR